MQLRPTYTTRTDTLFPSTTLFRSRGRKWPRCHVPSLLRVLFLGYAWLPIALALYIAQSLVYRLDGDFILGRAPAHALFIGFFGSLLVAMVTRVTQGHSGRPLAFGGVATFAFVVLQLVSAMRVAAELGRASCRERVGRSG